MVEDHRYGGGMIQAAIVTDPDAMPWRRAHAAVHGWRGEMIDLLAQAEAEVTATLLAMGCATNVRLVGARAKRLATLIGSGGDFAKQGAHARGALAKYQTFDPLRQALCHGRAEVTLNQERKWFAILCHTDLTATPECIVTVRSEDDAAAELNKLKLSVKDLKGQLKRVRSTLAAPPAPTPPSAPALEAQADTLLQPDP